MRNAREDATVSRSHRTVASILGDLGIRHEMEHLTRDAYFSVDLYLPDHDVAIEVDGPSHYIHVSTSYRGNGGMEGEAAEEAHKTMTTSTGQLMRRTPRTEVRDMFLARRHRAVVTVPWFELAELEHAGSARSAQHPDDAKKEYVAMKLRAVGVEV